MRDRFPVLFSLLSLIGLGLIYFAVDNVEAKTLGISAVDSSMTGRYVEVTGYVESAVFKENTVFVTLSDGYEEIEIVIFSELKRELGNEAVDIFLKDSVISVKGVVDEYKGSLEIIPGRRSDIKKLE